MPTYLPLTRPKWVGLSFLVNHINALYFSHVNVKLLRAVFLVEDGISTFRINEIDKDGYPPAPVYDSSHTALLKSEPTSLPADLTSDFSSACSFQLCSVE